MGEQPNPSKILHPEDRMNRHRKPLNFSVKFRLYLHPAYEYKYVALINNDILFITGCWRVVVEGLPILQLLSPK